MPGYNYGPFLNGYIQLRTNAVIGELSVYAFHNDLTYRHPVIDMKTYDSDINAGSRWFELGISGSSPTGDTGNNEKNPNQDLFLNASLIFQY